MKFFILWLCSAALWAQSAEQAAAEKLLHAGDYAAARRTALAAARLLEAAGQQKQPGQEKQPRQEKQLSDLLNTAGAAAIYQGDYPEALKLLERSLALAGRAGARDAEVLRLNNIGGLHVFLGNYGEAYTRYQQALTKSRDGATGGRQLTLSNLASLYVQLGQTQRALETYQQLEAGQAATSADVQAQTLANLAVTLRRLGDPHKALTTLQRAERLLASSPDAAAALYLRVNTGIIQALDFQNYPAALAIFRDCVALAERQGLKREAVLDRLFLAETLLRMGRSRDAQPHLRQSLQQAQALHLADEEWTAWYGLGRADVALGRTPDAIKAFESAVAIIESERSRLGLSSLKAEFLASKRDVYDAMVSLLLTAARPAAGPILRWIEGARARNLKDRLSSTAGPATLAAVQQKLPAASALVVYWAGTNQTAYVWVTTQGAGVVQGPRPARQSVDELARTLASGVPGWEEQAGRVSELLLASQLPGPGIRRLIFVPDGAIHRIPLELLPGVDGQRLIERYEVSYLPSSQFLLAPANPQAAGVRWPWQTTAAIFADPEVASASEGDLFPAAASRLTHSAEEARRIANALPGRAALYVGSANRKSHVFDPSTALTPVLHFATHAAADLRDARNSRLFFSGDNAASRYLFLSDLERLKLSRVDLVTLAACETEQGQYIRGEGVESFSRAFLAAGARATVSSLWRVSDASTSQFMPLFYGHLASGLTKGEALRATKLAFLRAGGKIAHPYYWAPFLLSGDADSRLSLPWSGWWLGGGLLLSCLALFGLAAFTGKLRTPRAASV